MPSAAQHPTSSPFPPSGGTAGPRAMRPGSVRTEIALGFTFILCGSRSVCAQTEHCCSNARGSRAAAMSCRAGLSRVAVLQGWHRAVWLWWLGRALQTRLYTVLFSSCAIFSSLVPCYCRYGRSLTLTSCANMKESFGATYSSYRTCQRLVSCSP